MRKESFEYTYYDRHSISLNTLVSQQVFKFLFALKREDTFNKCTN